MRRKDRGAHTVTLCRSHAHRDHFGRHNSHQITNGCTNGCTCESIRSLAVRHCRHSTTGLARSTASCGGDGRRETVETVFEREALFKEEEDGRSEHDRVVEAHSDEDDKEEDELVAHHDVGEGAGEWAETRKHAHGREASKEDWSAELRHGDHWCELYPGGSGMACLRRVVHRWSTCTIESEAMPKAHETLKITVGPMSRPAMLKKAIIISWIQKMETVVRMATIGGKIRSRAMIRPTADIARE